MTTIAITGARGFLGRHVVTNLTDRGDDVVRIGRNADGDLHRLGEDSDRPLFDGVQAVVHLAAQLVSGDDSMVSPYLEANVALTEQLAYDAAGHGVEAFVFASSRLVYPPDLGRDAQESDARPASAYGLSKQFAEMALDRVMDLTSLRTVSLRISQLIGPGDGGLGALGRFAELARSGDTITVVGSGRAVRDFLDVRDAASAIAAALDRLLGSDPGTVPPVLNIGGGASTIRQLAEIANDAAHRPGAEILHRETEDDDLSHWSLDCSLAASSIGWRPQYSLVEALRHRASTA